MSQELQEQDDTKPFNSEGYVKDIEQVLECQNIEKSSELQNRHYNVPERGTFKTNITPNMGMCRICHCGSTSLLHLGPLMSLCDCRGSVEMVHISCLEHWLTESGTDSCELCGYRFDVERIPRQSLFNSFITWVATDIDAKQMILDLAWFCVMTPLALFAGYLILMSTNVLVKHKGQDNPWIMLSLLMTSTLTLVAYYGWLVTAFRHHATSWWRWWRTNFIVHLRLETQEPQRINTITQHPLGVCL